MFVRYQCSLSVRSFSISNWTSDLAAALSSAIFSTNSISNAIRWCVVEGPVWSIFVIVCASLVSGTAEVVLNEDGLDNRRTQFGLPVVVMRMGF